MSHFDRSRYSHLQKLQLTDPPSSRITGIGCHLPERVVCNDELASIVTRCKRLRKRLPDLIKRSTGILHRRYAEPDSAPSDLGVLAARKALDEAGLSISDIDTLIFASTDMDTLEPATANIVQKKLGLRSVNAFDVRNACNSFIQAMFISNSLIATGGATRVLIISGEVGSRVTSHEIESPQELRFKMGGLTLGDAGAAMILEKSETPSGILESNLLSMGEHWELCRVPANRNWRQRVPEDVQLWFYLDMAGLAKIVRPTTFAYLEEYRQYRNEVYEEDGAFENLSKIIPHQISPILISQLAKAQNCDPALLSITAHEWGNIASASIPLSLQRTMEEEKLLLGSGKEVMLFGAASGYSIGHLRIRL